MHLPSSVTAILDQLFIIGDCLEVGGGEVGRGSYNQVSSLHVLGDW